jgi:hypothetical protein
MRRSAGLLTLSLLLLTPGPSPGEPDAPREEVCVVFRLEHENILQSYPGEERRELEMLVTDGLIDGPGDPTGDHEDRIRGLKEQFGFLDFSKNSNARNRLVIRLVSGSPADQVGDIVFLVGVEGESVDGTPPVLEWTFRDLNDFFSPYKPRESFAREIVTSFLSRLNPARPDELLSGCLSSVRVREGGLHLGKRLFAMPFSCREFSVSEWDSEFVAELSIMEPSGLAVPHRFRMRAHGLVELSAAGTVESGLKEYLGRVLAEATDANSPGDLERLEDAGLGVTVKRVFFARYILSNKCQEPVTPSAFTTEGD